MRRKKLEGPGNEIGHLAYKRLAATKASIVWFSYSHNCNFANRVVFPHCLPSLMVQGPVKSFHSQRDDCQAQLAFMQIKLGELRTSKCQTANRQIYLHDQSNGARVLNFGRTTVCRNPLIVGIFQRDLKHFTV